MSMRLPMIASLLLLGAPGTGLAQSLPVDFDAGAYAAPSGDVAVATNDEHHPPSGTETSAATARVVRRGGRTISLIGPAAPPPAATFAASGRVTGGS